MQSLSTIKCLIRCGMSHKIITKKKKAYCPYCCHIHFPLWGLTLSKKFKSLFTMSQHLPQNLDVITEQAVASSSGLSSTATWDIAKDYMVESFLDEENTSHSILVLSPNKLWHKAVDFSTQKHGILSQHSTRAYILNTSQSQTLSQITTLLLQQTMTSV